MDAAARLPAFREIKNLLEAGAHAPGQLQMELREADPIIRPLSAYADYIRRRTSAGDHLFPPEPKPLAAPLAALPAAAPPTAPAPAIIPVTLTEHQTTSKAS
jgi:hypothetical protein